MTERENQRRRSRCHTLSHLLCLALGPGYFGELRGQMLITHFLLCCEFFRTDSVPQQGTKSGEVRWVLGLAPESSSWPPGSGRG